MSSTFDVARATDEQLRAARLPMKPGMLALLEARAGTGKTTTFELIAHLHPALRLLYLCFNRANAEEARRRMPSNVEARSTHSLAYEFVGRPYQGKIGDLKVLDVFDLLHLDNPEDAVEILDLITGFLQSPAREIGRLDGGPFDGAVKAARRLWQRMIDPADLRAKLPHDGYLKLWALDRPVIRGFDAILVDEAQDTNPVVLEVLLNQRRMRTAALYFVGDRAQAIYGWRGATNAMAICAKDADFTCALTESFRFGPLLAERASRLLGLIGGPATKIVGLGDGKPGAPASSALIARTNAQLITAASAHHGPMHFAATNAKADFSPFAAYKLQEALDVHALYRGSTRAVKSPYIKRFGSFAELERFAFTNDPLTGDEQPLDVELAGFVSLTRTYGSALPAMIDRLCAQAVGPGAGVKTFTTAHRAKGLQWDYVQLTDDFVPVYDREKLKQWRDHLGASQLTEEMHLLYVALTRARVAAALPEALERWFQNPCLELDSESGDMDREPMEYPAL